MKTSSAEKTNKLHAVNALNDAGIKFILMPVLNDKDHNALLIEATKRLDVVASKDQQPNP